MTAPTPSAGTRPRPDEEYDIWKEVDVVEKDDDEQIVIAAAMVPNAVDRQGDFERPETIRSISSDFVDRVESDDGDADFGVMHAGFDVSINLEETRTLDSPESVGGKTYPSGTWLVALKVHDGDVWELVRDDVFTGVSIGGRIPDDGARIHAPDDVDVELSYPDGLSAETFEGRGLREILNAVVQEISLVDIPAVPDADFAVAKAALLKGSEMKDPDIAYQLLRARGHSHMDAVRVYRVIHRDGELPGGDFDSCVELMAQDIGDEEEAGRICQSLKGEKCDFMPSGPGESSESTETSTKSMDTEHTELDETDVGFIKRLRSLFTGDESGEPTEKAGRTLSSENRQNLMAAYDAVVTALSSDMNVDARRFTDDPRYDFDIRDYGKDDGADLSHVAETEPALIARASAIFTDSIQSPADSETPDNGGDNGDTSKMSDEDNTGNAPEWFKQHSARLDSIEEKLDDVVDDGDGGETEKDAEPPEWFKAYDEKLDNIEETVETVVEHSASPQQLGGDVSNGTAEEKNTEESPFMKGLVGRSE